MAGFDEYRISRVNAAPTRPMTSRPNSERAIIYTEESAGMLVQVEALQQELAALTSRIAALETEFSTLSPDLMPGPMDVATMFELSSDGTLRAAVRVTTPGDQMLELALFPVATSNTCTKDSYVQASNPGTNYDGGDLVAGNDLGNGAKRVLLDITHDTYAFGPPVTASGYWGVPPIALLRLAYKGTPTELALKCYALAYDSAEWTEAAVTWANQPAAEADSADAIFVSADDTYAYFNLAPYFARRRAHADASGTTTLNGFMIAAADEAGDLGEVTFYSKENAVSAAQKPHLLTWESPETSKVAGVGVRESRLYGKPGGEYLFMYRALDANNNASRWSLPVSVTLPSQGDTPAAPTLAVVEASLNDTVELAVTYTRPLDFDHFEIDVSGAATATIKTTQDRLQYWCRVVTTEYSFKVRAVTRSGQTSAWSTPATYHYDNVRIGVYGSGSYLLFNPTAGPQLVSPTGNIGVYDSQWIQGMAPLLVDTGSGPGFQRLLVRAIECEASDLYRTATVNYTATTYRTYKRTSGLWLYDTNDDQALVLVFAMIGLSTAAGDGARLALYRDGDNALDAAENGTVLYNEYGTDDDGYTTQTLLCLAAVSTPASHTFSIAVRSVGGGTVTVNRAYIGVLQLGTWAP